MSTNSLSERNMSSRGFSRELPAFSQNNSIRSIDSLLVIGIVAIAIFLSLFVFEFSRILKLAGKVNHASPARFYEPAHSDYAKR